MIIKKQIRIKENIRRISIISALWIVCLLFYHLLIYFAVDEVEPGTIDFVESMISGFVLGLLLGLTNGFLEVFIFRQHFKRMKFGYTVIFKTFLFTAAFIATVVFFILIKNYLLAPAGLYEKPVYNELHEFFGSPVFFKHGLYSVLISFGINFFLQVDSKMGKSVLFNLFFGRFQHPLLQEKIIMFLDLTSSTTIAERIGDQKYSAFMRDFFYDLDEIINETKGAVYQYVGDEVVVLWDQKEGVENNNCIRCYFEFYRKIEGKKERYNKLYGVSPQFKAGIHTGEVVVTEVGGLKSEIAYHGDTINTAARLRAEAKNYPIGLLISAELLGLLKYIDQSYCVESVGLIKLRGKKHDIAAFSVFEKEGNVECD